MILVIQEGLTLAGLELGSRRGTDIAVAVVCDRD